MNEFDSNLPEKTSSVLIGQKYTKELYGPLKKLGVEVIPIPDNAVLNKKISSHADLSVFHAGDKVIFLNKALKGSEFSYMLEKNNFTVYYSFKDVCGNFPDDVGLNICKFDKNVIYSSKYSDISAVNYLKSHKYVMIDSKQAYCRCSTAVVTRNSVITADSGIAESLVKQGIRVLKIEPGGFVLEGFNYGFIGGSCFKISGETLAFTGNLNMHPDKNRILGFLAENSVTPLFLTDNPAYDIGTAIPLN